MKYTKRRMFIEEDGTQYIAYRQELGRWRRQIRLRRAGRAWVNPGSLAMSLEDTGNGLVVTQESGKTFSLNYSEAAEIQYLLDCLGRPDTTAVDLKPVGKK